MLAVAALATSTYETSAPGTYRSALRRCEDAADARLLEIFDALYHLAQMTLHSKAVPFFSGRACEALIPSEVSRNCARTMLTHADSYTKLLSPYLEGLLDVTTLSPLVGFGLFVSASVFLAVETFAQGRYVNDAREGMDTSGTKTRLPSLQAIVSVLATLRKYWKVLQAPVCSSQLGTYTHEADH